jgi:hypothetical protein
MKRIYIKPETVLTTCRLCNMVMGSKTQWEIGVDDDIEPVPGGGDDDDPNKDAKGFSGLWDDVEDDEEDW